MNTSHKAFWMVGIVIIILIAGIALWRSNGPVTLGIGDTGKFNGISITPLALTQDSRCAVGVQCIWAGTVEVDVKSDIAGLPSREDTVTLGTTTQIGNFSVGLTSVSPEKTRDTVTASDYRFTFEVKKTQ